MSIGMGKKLVPLMFFAGLFALGLERPAQAAEEDSIQGLYRAVLLHDGTDYYQFAHITLRTVNTGNGQLKISANVRLMFGDEKTNEFLTYDYEDCSLNVLMRQISVKDSKNGVSFIGKLKDGKFSGDWYSTILGKAGTFVAIRNAAPDVPKNGELIKTLTGHYRGTIENSNEEANLPEKATISFVSTQDTTGTDPVVKISGSLRLYFGDFGSHEFYEYKFTDIQFNFYNRYLTAKTTDYGLTLKGTVARDGTLEAAVFADGLGEVGIAKFARRP